MGELRAIVTGVLLSVLGATAAQAQSVTEGGLTFNDAKHRGWYLRFWTGSCKDLQTTCMSGSPYWWEVIQRLLPNVPGDRREQLRARLIVLGQKIGYEWARENSVRRINDDHIKSWSEDLKRNMANPESVVARIEHHTRQLLGGRSQAARP